jgi:hypothetical protein
MTSPRIPTPEELDSNPELAILAALDSVARAARFAVIAIHPPLRDPVHDLTDPCSTDRAATAIAHHAEHLIVAIDDYRRALEFDRIQQREQSSPF